jgi:predicted adenine nucleotide alpha hydrolase (AANH) superfamily ATPase
MKVILHICCGICAAGAAERLQAEGHEVIGFFSNPNIHPEEEYQKRLAVARETSRLLNFPLHEGSCRPEAWREKIRGWEDAPEGGKRCEICFRIRLEETFNFMKDRGADAFTSTLTISPHKSAETISRIGRDIGGDKFLVRDFKKKDGYKRSLEIARERDLYRQDYCGCVYSIKKQ